MLRRACLVALSLLGLASTASADFMIVDFHQQVFLSNATNPNTTIFTLTFNQAPDFLTTDGFGTQANAFIGYTRGVGNDPADTANALQELRGDQIAANGNLIPVINGPARPPAGDVTQLVPYQVNGNVVTFTVDNASLGNAFGGPWYFEAYENGVLTNTLRNAAVPEPSSVALVAIGLALLSVKPLAQCYSRAKGRS